MFTIIADLVTQNKLVSLNLFLCYASKSNKTKLMKLELLSKKVTKKNLFKFILSFSKN